MFVTTIMIVSLFPTFRDSFGESLKNVPDSLKSILGEASDYQRLEGYLELQVLMQMVFFTIIYAVILCTGLIAGEENQGTLQTLLTAPVNRTKVFFQKLAASAVILWVVTFAMYFAIWLGAVMINEPINLGRLFEATFAMWVLTLTFGALGYSLGAATGRRGLAGGLAGSYAFATYLITSLAGTVTALKGLNNISPFKYFNNTRVMFNGLQWDNILIMLVASLLFILIGWVIFRRRDVYQH
jgi:ABC-2 type transport system permease protein